MNSIIYTSSPPSLSKIDFDKTPKPKLGCLEELVPTTDPPENPSCHFQLLNQQCPPPLNTSSTNQPSKSQSIHSVKVNASIQASPCILDRKVQSLCRLNSAVQARTWRFRQPGKLETCLKFLYGQSLRTIICSRCETSLFAKVSPFLRLDWTQYLRVGIGWW